MYVSEEAVLEMERRYGKPKEIILHEEISIEEALIVRGSQKNGRAHDVTFFIFNDIGHILLIAKHMFPQGAYRAPSGGLEPGEDFETGVLREAMEESGLRISLERYLVKVKVTFSCGDDVIPWTSYVFSGKALDTCDPCPIDIGEIKEARFGTLEELQGPIRQVLLSTDRGLFRYRVALTDAAVDALRDGKP